MQPQPSKMLPDPRAARPAAAPVKKLPLKSPGKAPAGAKLPLARPPQQPAAAPSTSSLPVTTSPTQQQQVPLGHPSEGLMYDPAAVNQQYQPHDEEDVNYQYQQQQHAPAPTDVAAPPTGGGYSPSNYPQQHAAPLASQNSMMMGMQEGGGYPQQQQQQAGMMMQQQPTGAMMMDPAALQQQQYQQQQQIPVTSMQQSPPHSGGDGTYSLSDPTLMPQPHHHQQPSGYGQPQPIMQQQQQHTQQQYQQQSPPPPLQNNTNIVMDDSFEDDGSPQLNSRTIDVAALPSDSLIRVAEMSRARRARLLADEESWVQEGNFQDKADEYVQHELKIVAADEETARNVQSKQEEKSRDRIQRLYAESLLHLQEDVSRYAEQKKFDAKKDAEIRRLRQEVHRQAFSSFWVKERGNTANMASPDRARKWAEDARRHGLPPSQLDKERSIGQVTNCLRIAYENSVPPFVTDPEEAWRRGVTVAPDLQRNGQSTRFMENDEVLKKLNLPSYHEYARDMQDRYAQWQTNNEKAAATKAKEEYEQEVEAMREREAKKKREIERAHARDFSLHPDHDHEHSSPFQGKNGAAKLGRASPDQRQVAYHMAFPEYYDSPGRSQTMETTRRSLYQ